MIRAVAGDLASVTADAVVRPATTWLEPLTSALSQLDAAAGPRFVEQRRLRHELAVGAAVVTGAGDLPVDFVIHLVLGTDENDVTVDAIRRATAAACWQCTQWQIDTLAMLPPEAGGLDVSLIVLHDHMRNADHPTNVLVVVPTEADAATLNARLGQDTN